MLSDREQRLISAAVDGELSRREQRTVQRLLEESVEAQRLFSVLQEQAESLRRLPIKALPAHFSCDVLRSLGERARATPSTYEPAAKRFLPIWANAAAAAAVMLAVCVGSYMVIILNEKENDDRNQAINARTQPETSLSVAPRPTPTPLVAPAVAANTAKTESTQPGSIPAPAVASNNNSTMPATPPDQKTDDVLGTPFSPKVEFHRVEGANLPPILVVRDLDHPASRARLHDALAKPEPIHVDLFCRDTSKAFERVQSVFASQGRKVVIEALAQDRLTRKLKTHYAFYSEALSTEDLEKLLQALGAEERKAEAKKDPQLDRMVVKTLNGDGSKILGTLLGVDPKSLPHRVKPVTVDPSKSLTDSTAEKLAQRLAEKGTGVRGEHIPVLALSLNPSRPAPSTSKEIRQFLENRKDAKGMSLIVIRTVD